MVNTNCAGVNSTVGGAEFKFSFQDILILGTYELTVPSKSDIFVLKRDKYIT